MTQDQFQAINSKTYFIDDIAVVTLPLEEPGYCVVSKGTDNFIFVNSALPENERSEVVSWGIKQCAERRKA